MAEYLILIYEDEKAWANADKATYASVLEGHNAFAEKHGAAMKGGKALWASDTATSIRQGTVTDGAFAETKEGLGGYYLIEAANLDDAIAIAKDVPAPFGGVEVRPVRVFD